jgi:hypothetical protein
MRITWLLDLPPGSELDDTSGLLADALAARDHETRIITIERPIAYFGGKLAEWIEVDDWRMADFEAADAVIATSARTARVAGDRAIADLEAVIVPDEIYRDRTPREHEPLRVLLPGPSQSEEANIDDGYGAITHARWFHQKVELVRMSPWAPSREEPLDSIEEYHVGLSAQETVRLLHSCDIVVVPGTSGLLARAAMAAGIPLLTRAKTAVELGEKLIEVLSDEALRERMRAEGREKAKPWRADLVAERLEEHFGF